VFVQVILGTVCLYALYWGQCVCTGYTGDCVFVWVILGTVQYSFCIILMCSPLDALDGGFEQANLADLCVVFGSSLTVTPAAEMPQVHHY